MHYFCVFRVIYTQFGGLVDVIQTEIWHMRELLAAMLQTHAKGDTVMRPRAG